MFLKISFSLAPASLSLMTSNPLVKNSELGSVAEKVSNGGDGFADAPSGARDSLHAEDER